MLNYNNNAGLFYAFMREMAEKHNDIKHVDNKDKHFFRGELEEFYVGLRSKVRFPALIVEGFELNYSDDSQTLKYRESAFTVAYSYQNEDDYDAITECYANSEITGEEILNKMKSAGLELQCQIRIENIHGVQIINETEKYAGVRFSFSLKKLHPATVNAEKWLNQE